MKTALRTLEDGREEKGRRPRLGGRAPPPVRRIPLLNGAARCRTPGSGAGPSEQPSRNFRRCGFHPRHGGWKAGGKRMVCRGAGGADERWMESGKQAEMAMFSIISRHRGRRFRGGGILPRRGGWREEERLATWTPRDAGGMREERRRRQTGQRGTNCGREAPVLPGRGRLAREVAGKRKTREKANVFHNLTRALRVSGRCDFQSRQVKGGTSQTVVCPLKRCGRERAWSADF